MLLGNYNQWNANPGRAVGGVTDPTYWFKLGTRRNFFLPDDPTNATDLRKAATPNGYYPPYAYVLPLTAGGMGSINTILCNAIINSANLAGGVNGEAAITATGALTATMQLIVSGAAVITATGQLTGNLNAIAPLATAITTSSSLTITLQALGNAVAAIVASGSLTGTSTAIGHMEADILPYSELSPESLAAAVWNSIATSFDQAGTMGEKLNLAGSGGVDYDALKQAVWEAALVNYETDPDSAANIVKRIQRVLGVDTANPITTTPTAITAGDMEIEVTGDGETTTTLTRIA